MTSSEIINLDREEQLRLMVCNPGNEISIQLLDGSAEIFGSPLLLNEDYKFLYFSAVSVFTWQGCTIKIKNNSSKYRKISDSKQIHRMIDLHKYMEEFCIGAYEGKIEGPISLVVGPTDAGKSTLCRVLLNYAVRDGRKPIFIDLDVGQGSLSLPGTVGILTVEEPSDFNGRYKEHSTSVYYFGYKSPGHNIVLYKHLIERLGKALKRRLLKEYHSRNSGVIINTCGWVDGPGYKLIKDMINLLNVNMVLVLCQNSLYYKLKNDVSNKTKILRVPDIKGTVVRNGAARNDSRNAKVCEYFNGSIGQTYIIEVSFDDLLIFKANKLPKDSSLDTNKENSSIISVPIEPSILHKVCALSYANEAEDILLKSVYGFVTIVDLDRDSKIASVLSPLPGPLPTKYLLMGDILFTPR